MKAEELRSEDRDKMTEAENGSNNSERKRNKKDKGGEDDGQRGREKERKL